MLVDTHCHLNDSLLSSRLNEVICESRRVGVTRFVVPGVHPSGWADIAVLARDVPGVFPCFGLHPQHADIFSEQTGAMLEEMLPQGVAVGEIGLDYLLKVPREVQLTAFREQLRLSVSLDLPVVLHCRKAFNDLLTILKEEQISNVGGVMHAFSGSPEVARECLRLGLYISIAGAVTYCNAVRPPEVVRMVPLDRLLLETDAPDMAPEPYRGKINEPAFLLETARKVAALKGMSLSDVADQTTANAECLFRLRKASESK